jgi:hypothetical protein
VLVQLHSAYMHSVGMDRALDLMEALLRHEMFAGAYRLNVSRIDIYADFQGWEPQVTDLARFVSFSRHRRGFQEDQQVYMTGPRLTGFMFGKGDLAARIYDKTVEIQRRGVSWLPDLWGIDVSGQPVWRLEFQYRRAVLAEFNLSGVDETVGSYRTCGDTELNSGCRCECRQTTVFVAAGRWIGSGKRSGPSGSFRL